MLWRKTGMNFTDAFNKVAGILLKAGSDVSEKDYDGLLVKRLESSNTLDEGRTTNQTHIAITGPQMDMFPYVRADAYFEVDYEDKDNDLKKYFVAQIPAYLHKENILHLDADAQIFSENEHLVHISIVRSRRKGEPDQIQMSMTNMDSPEYVQFRKIVHAKYYMIMLKRKKQLIYDIYCIRPVSRLEDVSVTLNGMNNGFFKLPTNTIVKIDELIAEDTKEKLNEFDIDEYKCAAKIVTDHMQEVGLQFDVTTEELDSIREEFLSKYSPEKLLSLTDEKLLKTIFYSVDVSNDNLCYFLEFNINSRKYFGSISGGSAFKFGLFQKNDDGQWTTGSPKHPKKLSEDEALELGKKIRDYLVNGAKLIENTDLNTPEDYELLNTKLFEVTEGDSELAWMHKYFAMLYPEKLTSYHNADWQKHILYSLKIKPSSTYYGRDGQISIIRKYAKLPYAHFFEVCVDKFGGIKKFLRLGTSDKNGNHSKELFADNCVGIGWNRIGDLAEYVLNGNINKKAVSECLVAEYYSEPGKASTASRKADELCTFYNANEDTIFVTMDGERPLALVDNIGENYFEDGKPLGHRRFGEWHEVFMPEDRLPNISEGHMTSCYELSDEENLMYLYEKYYYAENLMEDEKMNILEPYTPPVYRTELKTKYAMNRIVFGAPGTGKSYKLECDLKNILENGTIVDFERVTFHPDYTYAQFMGTYKPVSEGIKIYYKFVPGPFMRVYVEAIKNGKTKNPKPYVLLIEEINRARVAAVFGDVFQLLDRNGDGVSQYEIQASEDIRKYLSEELGGEPNDYRKIMLPNNMFIWATMNSADQGVFPMDTAFKRRWNFEYIGIDDNDEELHGKYVTIGSKKKQRFEWNELRKAINEYLAKQKINEDKQLGPYFISHNIVVPKDKGTEIDSEKFCEVFKNKVIMYLFEDAAKQRGQRLFEGSAKGQLRFSKICEAFDEQGVGIFNSEIQNAFEIQDLVVNGKEVDENGVPHSESEE